MNSTGTVSFSKPSSELRKQQFHMFTIGAIEITWIVAMFGAVNSLSFVAFSIFGLFVTVALRTRDAFYLKIPGAVINMLLALGMLVAFYGFHKALILEMVNKFIGIDKMLAINPKLNPEILTETFRVLSSQLPLWLILHSLLTIYAAANWNKWYWVFIRVPGFMIMVVLALGFAQASVLKGD